MTSRKRDGPTPCWNCARHRPIAACRLSARWPLSLEQAQALHQRLTDREAENAELRQRQILRLVPDVPLQSFVAMLGLAAALGEATMPDRSIPSVGASVQAYLTMNAGGLGIRFHQPEIGTATGLSTTNVELARIPPGAGQPVPRNLYRVLEDLQEAYSNPFWAQFHTAAQPPSQPAALLLIAAAELIANTGGWTFPGLAQSVHGIATLVQALAAFVAASVPGAASAAYVSAADSLASLAAALAAKPVGTSGDLFALAGSLDATTSIARMFAP
jgi:hypothetical protein